MNNYNLLIKSLKKTIYNYNNIYLYSFLKTIKNKNLYIKNNNKKINMKIKPNNFLNIIICTHNDAIFITINNELFFKLNTINFKEKDFIYLTESFYKIGNYYLCNNDSYNKYFKYLIHNNNITIFNLTIDKTKFSKINNNDYNVKDELSNDDDELVDDDNNKNDIFFDEDEDDDNNDDEYDDNNDDEDEDKDEDEDEISSDEEDQELSDDEDLSDNENKNILNKIKKNKIPSYITKNL